jgi:hypothetical protein
MEMENIVVGIWLLCGLVGALIAYARGGKGGDALLAIMAGPLSFITAFIFTKGTRRACPYCKEQVMSAASICPHCRSKLKDE